MLWIIAGVGVVLTDRGPSRVEGEGSGMVLGTLHDMGTAIGASFSLLPRSHSGMVRLHLTIL